MNFSPPHPYANAKGGVFRLTNAMNFGNNIRVGEQGTELGIVLSNRVVQALRERERNAGPIVGSIVMQSSGDFSRDRYWIERTIKDTVRKELNK